MSRASDADFPLADAIAAEVAPQIEAIERGEPCELLEKVTPVTSELIRWWFQQDAVEQRPGLNFHVGQRAAILAVIYAHEALGATSVLDLYEKVAKEAILDGRFGELTAERNAHPKYAAKMATGTGKTWVLNALLIWQYLNAVADPADPRFSTNFLIVAPGLIVYDRLLDSFEGRIGDDGVRDFATSDIAACAELFAPEIRRAAVLGFVQSSVIEKQEIGRKTTGTGTIIIANWQRLVGDRSEDPDFVDDDEDDVLAAGADLDWKAVAKSVLPLSPGLTTGNSLDVLDRGAQRGWQLDWLADLPNVVVFNDEAHHVHSGRKGDEASEVEWQRSLNRIAEGKGRRFVQIDFSATPYNEARNAKRWFDHIVVDFDLTTAIDHGLVKALAFDRRDEVASIPNNELEFRADRDENGVPQLSEGQRVMLRAGIRRLEILEEQFEQQDSKRRPKLLVIVEDTQVSPRVEDFLQECGFAKDDVLRIDSGRKAQLGREQWDEVRGRLAALDRSPEPRAVVSVLMLREGFDVNNICVIVPLRAAGSGILAEQTIGRGLRLMWRNEPTIEEMKRENRELIQRGEKPSSYFDVLFVVEHPRFLDLYGELAERGTIVTDTDTTGATGDAERIGLRDDYERYDFWVPRIIRDADEELVRPELDVSALPVSKYPITDLFGMLPDGDRFTAEDFSTKTRFGAFDITGAKLQASGYNDWLAKLGNRISNAVGRTFTLDGSFDQRRRDDRGSGLGNQQLDRARLVGWIDRYVRTRLFGVRFDPFANSQWRVLMIDEIVDEIAGHLAGALAEQLERNVHVAEPVVEYDRISSVPTIIVRRSSGVDVGKSVYPRLPVPARAGGLERLFIEWADHEDDVLALVKIHEFRHGFLRRPYRKADGMPALYSPDFLVRTDHEVFVVETKAQSALSDENVQRKQRAALDWCDRINELEPEYRMSFTWKYVLLGEKNARDWRGKGGSLVQLLRMSALARVRRESLPLF